MPVKAFTLVKIQPQKTVDVFKALTDVRHKLIFGLMTGRFDAVLYFERETPRLLAELTLESIRKVEGVTDTMTLFVLNEPVFKRELLSEKYPMKALLLAKVALSATTGMLDAIRTEPEIASLSIVTGEYDVAALFASDDLERLSELIFRFRNTPGVQGTETFILTTL